MIVKLNPALKSYLWGGTKLKTDWNKQTDEATLSEAWELSFHPDGLATVIGGKYDGKPLAEAATRVDWGVNCREFPFFPVLSKIIDSAQALSIQVHPSDEYALEHEGQFGKTEMWYILEADDGAFLYLGLNRTVSAEEFAAAIASNTVCQLLNRVPVKKGETYFIPSGTIHAIGSGVTLYEVQQNSSLTYRVYDFDRADANGNKRPLHVDKAKAVANLNAYDVPNPERGDLLAKCRYFSAYRFAGEREVGRDDSFVAVTVTDGSIELNGVALCKGETAFMSAGERAQITGGGEYILICVEQ